jgi:glycosyltransferase 2 family protein
MSGGRVWLRRAYRVSYFVLPAVLLFLVFRRIDFQKLLWATKQSNPWLVLLGVLYYPLAIFLGAWRWHALLVAGVGPVPQRFAIRHYWTGLALGYFVPGSLGWDAYRVIVAGRAYGRYAVNTAIIVAEKLAALFCCCTIIIALSPLVPAGREGGLHQILVWAYALAVIPAAVVAGLVWYGRSETLQQRVEAVAGPLGRKLLSRFTPAGVSFETDRPWKEILPAMVSGRRLTTVLAFSFAIQVFGGLANQIFFMALGHDVSWVANLFLGPVLFFIFLLPVSFGSLGVREVAYIGLYSLWGVPAETALLLSFFNLIGVLLNNALGGLVILGTGFSKAESQT